MYAILTIASIVIIILVIFIYKSYNEAEAFTINEHFNGSDEIKVDTAQLKLPDTKLCVNPPKLFKGLIGADCVMYRVGENIKIKNNFPYVHPLAVIMTIKLKISIKNPVYYSDDLIKKVKNWYDKNTSSGIISIGPGSVKKLRIPFSGLFTFTVVDSIISFQILSY